MKKAFAVAALAVGALAGTGPAQAQMYVRLDTGWSMANDADFKDKSAATIAICGDPLCNTGGKLNDVGDSYILGGGIGWRFNPNWRGDVTLTYRGGYELGGSDASGFAFKADLESTALMANGYYDFSTSGNWKPYVGAGIGWAQNKLGTVNQSGPGGTIATPAGKTNNTAFALMGGVAIPFSGWMLDLGLRYIDLGKFESASGTATGTGVCCAGSFAYGGAEGKLTAWEFTVGARF